MEARVTMPADEEIEERTRRAYFRLYGRHADQPGWVEVRGNNVTLGNLRGPLARFKIVKGKHGIRLQHMDDNRESGVGR